MRDDRPIPVPLELPDRRLRHSLEAFGVRRVDQIDEIPGTTARHTVAIAIFTMGRPEAGTIGDQGLQKGKSGMKHKTGLILAVIAVAATLTATAAAETLRLGTEGAYPPFNYMESDGTIAGFDVDIGLELCKRIGAECEVVAQDWDGIIPGLLARKYDFIVASMFITEERKKQVDFTDPYYLAAMTHVVPKGSDITEFTNEALSGMVIGAQSSTTQADYVEASYPDADVRLYPTQDEVNLDMASGRIDLQVGDMLPMLDWTTKSDDGACCELAGEPITDPAFVGEGVGIAIRQEDDELRERLNAALADMREDGTYQRINDEYFDIDVYTMK